MNSTARSIATAGLLQTLLCSNQLPTEMAAPKQRLQEAEPWVHPLLFALLFFPWGNPQAELGEKWRMPSCLHGGAGRGFTFLIKTIWRPPWMLTLLPKTPCWPSGRLSKKTAHWQEPQCKDLGPEKHLSVGHLELPAPQVLLQNVSSSVWKQVTSVPCICCYDAWFTSCSVSLSSPVSCRLSIKALSIQCNTNSHCRKIFCIGLLFTKHYLSRPPPKKNQKQTNKANKKNTTKWEHWRYFYVIFFWFLKMGDNE